MASEDESIWDLLRSLQPDKDLAAVTLRCPNPSCGSDSLHLEGSRYICGACSSCLEDRYIDTSAEWRHFACGAADPSRCGLPVNEMMPNASISTTVGLARGRCARDVSRISRYQMWNAMPYRERALYNALDPLLAKMTQFGITLSIADEARAIYKRVCDSKMLRGDNRMSILATAFYIACKNQRVARSAKEVAEIFDVDQHSLTRVCKRVQELFEIKLPCSEPHDFVRRFASQLELNEFFIGKCDELVADVEASEVLSDCSPTAVAASCINYVVQHAVLGIKRSRIAEVCKLSDVTVAKIYKRLVSWRASTSI
jgi:transcription initiation factor TFIIB